MTQQNLRLLDIVPVVAEGILNPTMKADMARFLMPGTTVDHVQIGGNGPITIESEFDEAFAAPEVVRTAVSATDAQHYDGIFVNCFGDPGVRATRERLPLTVFGGFEPAIYMALGLGDTVGIVTVLDNVLPMLHGAVARAGLRDRVTTIRSLDIPVLQLEDHDLLMTNLYAECKKAIEEDDVDVLVMGCTGIVGIVEEMTTRLAADGYDIPVLEAAQCAMLMTEVYARMGIHPSRKTYTTPPEKDVPGKQ